MPDALSYAWEGAHKGLRTLVGMMDGNLYDRVEAAWGHGFGHMFRSLDAIEDEEVRDRLEMLKERYAPPRFRELDAAEIQEAADALIGIFIVLDRAVERRRRW